MKKTYKLLGAVLLLASLTFTACYNPIFYEIRRDVEPEEATINGDIGSIARYTVGSKEYLVLAANGGLYYKSVDAQSHGEWHTYDSIKTINYDFNNSAHHGEQIIKVLTDSDYIYLVTASYTQDEGSSEVEYISIWAKKIIPTAKDGWSSEGDWTLVLKDTDNEYFPFYYTKNYAGTYGQKSAFNVFYTNAPQKENRRVFVRSGSVYVSLYKNVKYYELKNGKIEEITAPVIQDYSKGNANSAAMLDDQLYFFESQIATTNETYTAPATNIYYGRSSYLYYSTVNDSNELVFKRACDADRTIVSIATCNDTILMGCAEYETSGSLGGIKRAVLKDGIPGGRTISFDSNAEFQLGSSYHVNVLLNSTPHKNEEDSALYAVLGFKGTSTNSGVSPNNRGLWSYYPGRGNWNRE